MCHRLEKRSFSRTSHFYAHALQYVLLTFAHIPVMSLSNFFVQYLFLCFGLSFRNFQHNMQCKTFLCSPGFGSS
jgi:hypothetical protein